jgi:peptide/nickel transport system ATP-binding protein
LTAMPEPHATAAHLEAEIRGLRVTFSRDGRAIRAVRGVDLSIRSGEILGLVGESGSGKTVLAQTILGLIRQGPTVSVTGEVLVARENMLTVRGRDRRRILREHLGAVFQDPMTSLNPSMRIGRQVREVTATDDEVVAGLEAAGLGHAATRLRAYPHQLSGGQRQRVMIAMAVGRRPNLVVADEPTTALDVTVQAQILRLIRALRGTVGSAFLLVTHDLGVAAEVADRIAVMYAGRIVELGPARELLDRPRHPYTRGLLGSRLSLYGARRADLPVLPGFPPDPTTPDQGCAFAPRCAWASDECAALPPLAASEGREVACWRLDRIVPAQTEAVPQVASLPISAPATDVSPIVSLRAVRREYHVRMSLTRTEVLHALRDVDLDLHAGEAIAVVGESGCGKSTLLRVIAGLEPVDGGALTRAPGCRPQMVFQDATSSLTPWLGVRELIEERLSRTEFRDRTQRVARVNELLELVGLPRSAAAARPGQLSGGQNQRVALARAVASQPRVLLADEPTSALDVSLAATVLNLVRDLRQRLAFSLVFVTHDLAVARTVSERIAVMYLGQIVELGPTEAVIGDPRHPYTRALVASVPGRGGNGVAAGAVRGDPPNPLRIPTGCPYHPRCPLALDVCAGQAQELLPAQDGSRLVRCILRGVPDHE